MSQLLGGIIGFKYKTSSWHLNGSPMVVTLGQQYDVGEKLTVILYTYINLIAVQGHQTKSKNKTEIMEHNIQHGSNNILFHRL